MKIRLITLFKHIKFIYVETTLNLRPNFIYFIVNKLFFQTNYPIFHIKFSASVGLDWTLQQNAGHFPWYNYSRVLFS